MIASQIYILVAVVVLALLFVFNFTTKTRKLGRLAGIAFGFVIAGIVFGENKLISYLFFALGIILSVVDAIIKSKK